MMHHLRMGRYTNVASTLGALSNRQLETLLETTEPHHTGIGGASLINPQRALPYSLNIFQKLYTLG